MISDGFSSHSPKSRLSSHGPFWVAHMNLPNTLSQRLLLQAKCWNRLESTNLSKQVSWIMTPVTNPKIHTLLRGTSLQNYHAFAYKMGTVIHSPSLSPKIPSNSSIILTSPDVIVLYLATWGRAHLPRYLFDNWDFHHTASLEVPTVDKSNLPFLTMWYGFFG